MITGFFIARLLPQPLLQVAVVVDDFDRPAALMPFIVDTGAARTIIHGKDAVRYFAIPESELDSSTWTNAKPMLGLGGPVRCKEASAHFAFRHDSGDVEIISEKVLIGASESEVMPSLLGWDLLKYFRLDIHGGDQTIVLHRV